MIRFIGEYDTFYFLLYYDAFHKPFNPWMLSAGYYVNINDTLMQNIYENTHAEVLYQTIIQYLLHYQNNLH